jgi:hypothetical protein
MYDVIRGLGKVDHHCSAVSFASKFDLKYECNCHQQ